MKEEDRWRIVDCLYTVDTCEGPPGKEQTEDCGHWNRRSYARPAPELEIRKTGSEMVFPRVGGSTDNCSPKKWTDKKSKKPSRAVCEHSLLPISVINAA